jgi:hypothetical protein
MANLAKKIKLSYYIMKIILVSNYTKLRLTVYDIRIGT